MNIVLVTQDVSQISAWARSLIETTFVHSKLSVLGADKKYRVAVYRGAPPTVNPPQGGMIRELYGTYRKEVYACYESHTMREADGSGANEKAIDRRANFWRRPLVWGGLAFVVVGPVWAVNALYELVAPAAPAAPASVASTRSQAAAVVPFAERIERPAVVQSAPTAVAAPRARSLPDYRVSGVVRGVDDERKGFAMIERDGRHVSVPLSECWFAGDGLTRCSVDGFTVTEFGVTE